MKSARKNINVKKGMSIQRVMKECIDRTETREEAVRLFLGQDLALTRRDLSMRGEALDLLRARFFYKWSLLV